MCLRCCSTSTGSRSFIATSCIRGEWVRANEWSFWRRPLAELAGRTIGIVGFWTHRPAGRRNRLGVQMNVLANDVFQGKPSGVSGSVARDSSAVRGGRRGDPALQSHSGEHGHGQRGAPPLDEEDGVSHQHVSRTAGARRGYGAGPSGRMDRGRPLSTWSPSNLFHWTTFSTRLPT